MSGGDEVFSAFCGGSVYRGDAERCFTEEFNQNICNASEKLTACAISECSAVHKELYDTRDRLQLFNEG